jgi:hypothetical protein
MPRAIETRGWLSVFVGLQLYTRYALTARYRTVIIGLGDSAEITAQAPPN